MRKGPVYMSYTEVIFNMNKCDNRGLSLGEQLLMSLKDIT
jgi:hypothetical protein